MFAQEVALFCGLQLSEILPSKDDRLRESLEVFASNRFGLIESTSRTDLLFQVQTHLLSKHKLVWSDGDVKVIYVDLRGMEENYGVVGDNNTFKIC